MAPLDSALRALDNLANALQPAVLLAQQLQLVRTQDVSDLAALVMRLQQATEALAQARRSLGGPQL